MPNPFDQVPIEVNQIIASFLDSNKDITTFNRISRSTHYAIDEDGLSFWRRRFLKVFEMSDGIENNKQYKFIYQRRSAVLAAAIKFKRGTSGAEKACLEILLSLILEASNPPFISDSAMVEEQSPNLKHVIHFLLTHRDFMNVTVDQTIPIGNSIATTTRSKRHPERLRFINPLLPTIQVLMAPLLLDPFSPLKLSYRFPEAQRSAYAHADTRRIFSAGTAGGGGSEINMVWILHQLSFWQWHMTREREFTLFEAYTSLTPEERPRMWSGKLSPKPKRRERESESKIKPDDDDDDDDDDDGEENPFTLGKRWKGSYAFVSRGKIHSIRAGEGEDEMIQDEFSAEASGGVFHDLTLDLTGDDSSTAARSNWPAVFEHHLGSLTGLPGSGGSPKTRSQHRSARAGENAVEGQERRSRSFRFDGEGGDVDEEFLADGWLNPLPDQNGVPGWMRMTMMKYFLDENEMINYHSLWAYEGVVLPGGEIIVGRWWSPNDGNGESSYSGPFILWCVDSKRLEGLKD